MCRFFRSYTPLYFEHHVPTTFQTYYFLPEVGLPLTLIWTNILSRAYLNWLLFDAGCPSSVHYNLSDGKSCVESRSLWRCDLYCALSRLWSRIDQLDIRRKWKVELAVWWRRVCCSEYGINLHKWLNLWSKQTAKISKIKPLRKQAHYTAFNLWTEYWQISRFSSINWSSSGSLVAYKYM